MIEAREEAYRVTKPWTGAFQSIGNCDRNLHRIACSPCLMLVSAMEDLTQPREIRATYRR